MDKSLSLTALVDPTWDTKLQLSRYPRSLLTTYSTDEAAKEELVAGGGDLMVPCLRIGDSGGWVSWMYESKDIIGYLEGLFVAG